MNLNPFRLDEIIKKALEEDIEYGDITTEIVDRNVEGRAYFLAKEDFVLCGVNVAKRVFKLYDEGLSIYFDCNDGERVKKGQRLGTVSGKLRSILICERTALNFLQRMSGIATLTAKVVDRVSKNRIVVLDTRKTTPLLRIIEKYAVRIGGGQNHRLSLSDGILIKDNHIKACGSISKAIKLAKKIKRPLIGIGVEVKTLEEVEEALKNGADHLLLDNMSPDMIKNVIQIVENRATIEVSGNINLDNVQQYALEGVNFISIGSLTHSAKAVDISLEIE